MQHIVAEGTIYEEILKTANLVNADLIVMATHGRSGLERLRLGSVAEGLVTRGVAPMLLFHPGPDGPSAIPESIDRVVVALDHSPFAQSILEPVERLGKAVGVSTYTLVHVAESNGPFTVSVFGYGGYVSYAYPAGLALEHINP